MGRQLNTSDEGGLFTIELSSNGDSAFLHGNELSPGNRSGSSGFDGSALAAYTAPSTMLERKLLEAVRRIKDACRGGPVLDQHLLLKLLTALGYTVGLQAPTPQCNCKTSNRKCLEVLSHTYLLCTGTVDYASEMDIVIEPRLREQFEIAHQTAEYKRLLKDVPAEYVGSRAKLKPVVEAISAAMAEAFTAQDLPLPPWRRTAAALSKWDLDTAGGAKSPACSPEAPNWQPPSTSKRLEMHGLQKYGFPENLHLDSSKPHSGGKSLILRDQLHNFSADRAGGGYKQAAKPQRCPPVSLLARGLAEMALAKKPERNLEGKASRKLKRAPSWDFSGLAPITTVKRSGRVK